MSIKARSIENFQVEIISGKHTLLADEPISVGGDDNGPNPYDILMTALASCKIITTQRYARRKGWDLTAVSIEMSTKKFMQKIARIVKVTRKPALISSIL